MKKVRFEMVPNNSGFYEMRDKDCHFPRPFLAKEEDPAASSSAQESYRLLQMKLDPLKMFENSNSAPYSISHKTPINNTTLPEVRIEPSNDLDLSILESHSLKPRKPGFFKDVILSPFQNGFHSSSEDNQIPKCPVSSLENVDKKIPGTNPKDNSFFIKHDNINVMHLPANCMPKRVIDKENNPFIRKAELVQKAASKAVPLHSLNGYNISQITEHYCNCHHCNVETKKSNILPHNMCHNKQVKVFNPIEENIPEQCPCAVKNCVNCMCEAHSHSMKICQHSTNQPTHMEFLNATNNNSKPENALEKKITTIQNYEQTKRDECRDIEKSSAVAKQKREPTVADLFKIIKLQNEQLQLLQEKVDKFISVTNKPQPNFPIQNCVTEQIALDREQNDHNKISIGVMTSFEMFRTSTIINKEVVKQTISNNNRNAQVQCNRSQISIKEFSFREPVHQNFLDGIQKKNTNSDRDARSSNGYHETDQLKCNNFQSENLIEEKAFNDMSLCDVQVDNATTPQISPEQSMYLDVRDYSESDSGSDEQSNVGWTYYNKIMTHVNGMLQDSDMPSSASALYRNTRQQCVQMQIDKTNISVTKRVKFGDDPVGLNQQHVHSAPLTDTSMKMNQLAAKYLKTGPQKQFTTRSAGTNEMSFATRNYMERHQLLQASKTPKPEMPRFLDITALKQQQQHKFL